MRNVKNIILFGLCVVVFMACEKKPAASSFDDVKSKGVLVLGLDDSFPPMGFRNENGEIVGFDIDLAHEVCNILELRLECQPINWNLKEMELNSGKIDCIWNGFTSTPERADAMLLSKPYLNNSQVVVVKADSKIKKLSDLTGKKIAIQAGSSAAFALDEMPDFKSSLGEISEWQDNLMAFMDLDSQGSDAVVVDGVVAGYKIAAGGNFKILDEVLASEKYVIAFRKGDSELCKKVEDALKSLEDSGKLAEISKKWFARDISVRQ